jgi:hypothetical protein
MSIIYTPNRFLDICQLTATTKEVILQSQIT